MAIPDRNNLLLIVSFTGFASQTIVIDTKNYFEIRLVSNPKNLYEIVVIGYVTVRKRDLTGSVISLKGDEWSGSLPIQLRFSSSTIRQLPKTAITRLSFQA